MATVVGGIVNFGGDLTGTNCFTSSTVRRALTGMAGVHVKEGGPGGGLGGCLKGGVAIGGERSGNGSDGGDVGLLGDGVGVGGGAPWGFGLGPREVATTSAMVVAADSLLLTAAGAVFADARGGA